MPFGVIVLIVYGLLMIVGGAMGARAGSKASLIAGGASGVLLLVAAWLAAGPQPVAGLWMGAAIALILCVTFGARLAKTGKVMPSGGLLGLSAVALVLLVWAAA